MERRLARLPPCGAGVRRGLGSRRSLDRLSGLASRHQRKRRDLARTGRRVRRSQPDAEPCKRLGAGLVPGRAHDRVQLRSRRRAPSGYLVSPDGSDLRRIRADAWIEYPSFSPDGTKIAFMGHDGGDYDVYVADLETGATRRLYAGTWFGRVAGLVTGWIDHRLCLRARRLPVRARDGAVLGRSRRRARRPPRHLADGRGRLEPAPCDARVRPVRGLVAGRRAPPRLRLLPVCDPPGRNRSSGCPPGSGGIPDWIG